MHDYQLHPIKIDQVLLYSSNAMLQKLSLFYAESL